MLVLLHGCAPQLQQGRHSIMLTDAIICLFRPRGRRAGFVLSEFSRPESSKSRLPRVSGLVWGLKKALERLAGGVREPCFRSFHGQNPRVSGRLGEDLRRLWKRLAGERGLSC